MFESEESSIICQCQYWIPSNKRKQTLHILGEKNATGYLAHRKTPEKRKITCSKRKTTHNLEQKTPQNSTTGFINNLHNRTNKAHQRTMSS